MPVAEPADAGPVRRDRGPGGPQQARRPQDQDIRGRAAREHARAKARPAADPCRRTRAGGIDAGALRGAAERNPAHTRRGADRPARHGPLDAARLQGIRAARKTTRSKRTPCRARRRVPKNCARRVWMRRNTRPRRGSRTWRRCAMRWAMRSGTSGEAATARASPRNTCAGIRTAYALRRSTPWSRRR